MTEKDITKKAEEAAGRRLLRRENADRAWTASTKRAEEARSKWTDADLDDVWSLVEGICEILSGLRERVARLEGGGES